MISFEEFKKKADKYFNSITPEEMVKHFEAMGYEFVDKDEKEDEIVEKLKKKYPFIWVLDKKKNIWFGDESDSFISQA